MARKPASPLRLEVMEDRFNLSPLGLPSNEQLVGIDFRPQEPGSSTAGYGFDFNATVDAAPAPELLDGKQLVVYTRAGLRWIEDNTMLSVLRRHYPELGPSLRSVGNAFHPWERVGG